LRVQQGQGHRHLAAHAVTHHRRLAQTFVLDESLHVVGHLEIAHRIGPGRRAVVAQVDCKHAMRAGQSARNAAPVVARAEQAVQDHQRRPAAG
jgi:hypothetical protein